MNLVDRYLEAVKVWLPSREREDIIAELREDIRSEIEEKESALGRGLTDTELEALIKRRGRPIVAAGRFRPQQSLIGPTLFPIYMIALKAVAIPFVASSIGRLVYFAMTSGIPLSHAPSAILNEALSILWSTGLFLFGGLTLVFAILEHVQRRRHFLEEWNPRKLVPVRDKGRIPRSSSITEFVVQIAFAIWWIRPQAFFTRDPGHGWTAGPTWANLHGAFFWPILILALGTAALNLVEIIRNRRSRLRAGLRAGMELATTWIAVVVLLAHWPGVRAEWMALRGRSLSEAAGATAVMDILVYIIVAFVGVAAFVTYLIETVRAIRLRAREGAPLRPAPGATEAVCL